MSHYEQSLKYLKEFYGLDAGDLNITEESAKESELSGETPQQYIEYYAEKYGLTKHNDLILEDAIRVLEGFDVKVTVKTLDGTIRTVIQPQSKH